MVSIRKKIFPDYWDYTFFIPRRDSERIVEERRGKLQGRKFGL